MVSLICVGLMLFLCVMCTLGGMQQQANKPDDPHAGVRAAGLEFAKRGITLHDPASAEWPWDSIKHTLPDDDGWYTVRGNVRAKNGFGAYRLLTWRVKLRRSGDKFVAGEITIE